jgi:hypothetical protein
MEDISAVNCRTAKYSLGPPELIVDEIYLENASFSMQCEITIIDVKSLKCSNITIN